MKKTLISIAFALLQCSFAFCQETTTASSGEKKVFIGIGGSGYLAEQLHIGGRLEAEYFFSEKVSLDFSYNFGYSRLQTTDNSPVYPVVNHGSNNTAIVPTQQQYNYVHLFAITPTYYVIGGANAAYSVFIGAGPALSWVRSSEYGQSTSQLPEFSYNVNNNISTWYGINLNLMAGVDYAVGPGKVFLSAGYAPRLFCLNSPYTKQYFKNLVYLNVGYKFGF